MRSIKNSSKTANNSLDDAFEPPPLAMRCDGKLVVSIADIPESDLRGRELWTGLVLSPSEADAIYRRCHFEEAAATIVSIVRASAAKAQAKPMKRTKRRIGNE